MTDKQLLRNVDNAIAAMKNAGKREQKVEICVVDTGTNIYTAYLRIAPTKAIEYWVSKQTKNGQFIAKTQIDMTTYGHTYSNQGGKISLPQSVSRWLHKFKDDFDFELQYGHKPIRRT